MSRDARSLVHVLRVLLGQEKSKRIPLKSSHFARRGYQTGYIHTGTISLATQADEQVFR